MRQLISAAKEIERLYNLQKSKTKELVDLAKAAKTASGLELKQIQSRVKQLDSVVDFTGAIEQLIKALHGLDCKKGNKSKVTFIACDDADPMRES